MASNGDGPTPGTRFVDARHHLLLVQFDRQPEAQGWIDGTREDLERDDMPAVFYTAAECRAYVRAMRGMVQGGATVQFRVEVVELDAAGVTYLYPFDDVVDGDAVFEGRR